MSVVVRSSRTRPCLLSPLTSDLPPALGFLSRFRWLRPHAGTRCQWLVLMERCVGQCARSMSAGSFSPGQTRRLPCLYFCSIYHFVFKHVSFTASRPEQAGGQMGRREGGMDTTLTKPRQVRWEIAQQLQPWAPTMDWNGTGWVSGRTVIKMASLCWWRDARLAKGVIYLRRWSFR